MKRKYLNEKIFYILTILLIVLPSVLYLLRKKTFVFFDKENCFLQNDLNIRIQTVAFIIVITLAIIAYFSLIRKRNNFFKDIKSVFIFIFIISTAFIVVTPFLSSDIYYYMGIGRLGQEYHQNPYYVTMMDFVNEKNIDLSKDTMLEVGYDNPWASTTVVYGPIWTLICEIFAKFSFGNADIGMIIFKIASIVVHILNCYIIYKISRRKLFVLIYGLNPYVLIEGIGNLHNDIYLLLFTLLALYMISKKNKIFLSLIFLSFAVDIKFVMILLLPFIVLYYLREQKVLHRIVGCCTFGVLFFIMTLLPFLLYMEDFSIFTCMLVQRERYCNSIYLQLYFYGESYCNIVKNISMILFVIMYFIICVKTLISKKIDFKNSINIFFYIIFIFIFALLTNFQPWYLIWLLALLVWLKPKKIKFIINLQFSVLISYIALLLPVIIYIIVIIYSMIIIMLIRITQKLYSVKHRKKIKAN